ncbi:RNA-directed DNA polymerase from retron EC86 [Vibrio antiquarius]|uniref:RNA-directed DNA polymerase n=2 Tax=Vibrio antiquarius (strain Ex25) TaxID=150340 RepID=A0ABM9WWG4_VIBAE|nr:retron St85 family RNA-directed DNA polymerase [Vibrio antiquarius]ACY52460.1 putative reverse transcriptase [Vibrio antiquarius]EDN57643.1 RNA-directed DNA polymerase from retron EC86 [Vibrio antiquarius]
MENLLKEICSSSDLSIQDVIKGLSTAPLAYKVYTIPKRTKGERVIAQPSPFVKEVQRTLISVFLTKYKPSEVSTAYVEGKSIIDNAEAHKDNDWILKLDFKNFFPSLKPNDLFTFLEREGVVIGEFDKKILSSYLFRRNNRKLELSIGAPSSPLVSNLIMKSIDNKIEGYCNDNSIVYTRYADDLTFSTMDLDKIDALKQYIAAVLSETKSPKLSINDSKTKVIGRGRSRRVTGIVLTHENKLSVGRYSRKKIRAMVHHYSNRTIKKSDIPYLHGVISHMRSVEPDYYQKLEIKYGSDFFSKLAMDSYKISKAVKLKKLVK